MASFGLSPSLVVLRAVLAVTSLPLSHEFTSADQITPANTARARLVTAASTVTRTMHTASERRTRSSRRNVSLQHQKKLE